MKIKVVILATSLVAINCLAGETLVYDPIGGGTTPGFELKDFDNFPDSLFTSSSYSDNEVKILSTKKEINKAMGGYSESKNVSNNKLIVENNKDIQIFAIETGKSDKGDVNVINNKTIVKGGKIKYVNGGVASEGNAEGNTVIIENGTIEKKL